MHSCSIDAIWSSRRFALGDILKTEWVDTWRSLIPCCSLVRLLRCINQFDCRYGLHTAACNAFNTTLCSWTASFACRFCGLFDSLRTWIGSRRVELSSMLFAALCLSESIFCLQLYGRLICLSGCLFVWLGFSWLIGLLRGWFVWFVFLICFGLVWFDLFWFGVVCCWLLFCFLAVWWFVDRLVVWLFGW